MDLSWSFRFAYYQIKIRQAQLKVFFKNIYDELIKIILFTLDVYVEALTDADQIITERFRLLFSQFQVEVLHTIEKDPKNHDASYMYGILAIANCPNFIKINSHIEKGFYTTNHSLIICMESCPRKNYVGQLQYILPSRMTSNFLQVLSDLIRVDQMYKTRVSMKLLFTSKQGEYLADTLIKTSQTRYGHLKLPTSFQMFNISSDTFSGKEDHVLQKLYGVIKHNSNRNTFIMFADYQSASFVIKQILRTIEDRDDFDYFAWKSYWIIVLLKPLSEDENIETIFSEGLTNVAVVNPNVSYNYTDWRKLAVDCIAHSMEKYLLTYNSSKSALKSTYATGVQNSQKCFDEMFNWTVYSSLSKNGVIVTNQEKWIPGYGFNHSLQGIFMSKRIIKNAVVKGLIYHNPPWTIINNKCNRSNVNSATGIAVQLMRSVQERLSFQLDLVCLDEFIHRNNGFNSSMSKWEITSQILQQKLVDIVIAATVITPAREQLVDFLVPFHTEDFVLVSAKPKLKSVATVLLEIFELETWCVLGLLALLFTISLILIKNITMKTENIWMITKSNMSECFLIMSGIIFQQSVHLNSRSYSTMVLLLTWILLTIVVCGMYNGSLFSFMSSQRYNSAIRTLDDVFEDESLTLGITKDAMLNSNIMHSYETKITKAINKTVIHDSITVDIMNQVKSKRHVLIERETAAKMLLDKQVTKRGNKIGFVIGDSFFKDKVSFAVYKNNPLQDILNNELLDIISNGHIDKWKREFFPILKFKFEVSLTVKEKHAKLTIRKFQGATYILIVGIIAAMFLLLVEYAVSVKLRPNAKCCKF
ncbi:hypothetical protein CHUAL_009349 [Chamberlinius hualienensis]